MESEQPGDVHTTWPVIGHDWAVALLRQSLSARRIAHAYLLTGPPQVGKTCLALALAQALNCLDPDPPCGRCPSCEKIERRLHADVRLIVGEGAGETIKIDQVRALQREAMLAPYEGRYRVFILCQAEQATPEAANSLLKTLEEPPAHVVLVLTALYAEALPPTLVSRCQRLDLRPIARPVVEAALRDRGIAAEKAQLLARLSGGRLGWAIAAAQEDGLLRQREQVLDRLAEALAATRVERLELAQKLGRDLPTVRQLIELWTGWWRDLLCLGLVGDALIGIDRIEELRSMERRVSRAQIVVALHALQTAAAQLEANVNPRLALEELLLQLPSLGRQPARGEI